MRSLSLARLSGLLLLGALGCGLISSDITKVTFDLPTKHYTFSASQFSLPAGTPNQPIPCGPACVSPLVCDSNVCAAHVPLSVWNSVNLKMEVGVLSSVNSQTLADITLESMSYAVVNTSNIAIPPIELYLAPDGVKDPSDPRAQKFATVPMIPAGTNASGDVTKEPGADALFTMYGQNFGTPFNFIAATTVVVPTGTNPTGMVDITINGKIAAQL
ncbi:MAG TPA: hypothetical protein VHL80_12015 [Polyangia bacterium]|nr:hypothetical protein [Polyangia bacterium]